MKKLITILLLFICYLSEAQITYTPMVAQGYRFKYSVHDSGFAIPFRDLSTGRGTTRPGPLVVNTVDSLVYFWNGIEWALFGGQGGQDTIYVTDDLYVTIDSLGHQVIHRFHNDGLETPGIVTWTGTGLTFAISPTVYYLNQIRYTTPADTITLDPADPSLPRRDVFIVDTVPSIGKITGTAAADPLTPQEDPASQIILAEILLNAGDLTPSNVAVNKIYDQNIEWTPTTTGTITVDFDDTNNPYIGSKAAFVSVYNNNSKILFTYSGTESVDPGETLKLFFYSNGGFTNKLRFQFFNTGSQASKSLTISSGFGLNPVDSNNYQNISIPLSAFKWNSTTFNRLVITNIGSDISGTKGYYIDNIQLQTGITNLPPSIDYSNKLDSVTLTKTTVGADTTNLFKQWVKGIPYTIGTVWTGGSGGGGSARFGKSGEDATAGEHRNFDLNTQFFNITNAGKISFSSSDTTLTNDGGYFTLTPSSVTMNVISGAGAAASDISVQSQLIELRTDDGGSNTISTLIDPTKFWITDFGVRPTTAARTRLNIGGVQEFTDNAAALAGGLVVGDVYRNGDILQIVH